MNVHASLARSRADQKSIKILVDEQDKRMCPFVGSMLESSRNDELVKKVNDEIPQTLCGVYYRLLPAFLCLSIQDESFFSLCTIYHV